MAEENKEARDRGFSEIHGEIPRKDSLAFGGSIMGQPISAALDALDDDFDIISNISKANKGIEPPILRDDAP